MPIYTKCGSCGKKILKGTKCECRKDRYKEYDKRVRLKGDNKQYAKFYNSVAWKRMSASINKKYNGMCLMCLLRDKSITPSDVVHHIETIRERFDKKLEEENLIPLCHRCHNNIDHINYSNELKNELRRLLLEYEKKYI